MKTFVLDANVLVRFLAQDSPTMSRAAKKMLQDAENGNAELHLDPTIIAEVIFVLTKVYHHTREEVADAMLDLIENPGLKVTALSIVRDALKRFKEISVDFPDAWIAAIAAEIKVAVASFDHDIDKFKDITRYEPKA